MLARLMPLLTLLRAELAFGTHPLLDRAEFSLEPGERIGLIGRNGTGKSSLLEVIAGRIALDDGELQKSGGVRVVSIRQEPELPAAPSLRESLALWAELDSIDDDRVRWRVDARIVEYLHRFGLEGTATTAGLSGGERKRAALAGAFALEPDVLLLDEPTNHLDIDGIERLEDLIIAGSPAVIVVTHDRSFLDRVATRIVELDRGMLRSYPGNYAAYEQRKAEQLAEEAVLNRKFDKFWAQEEVWIRKGVEARRTRNEGRVKRLEQLRCERDSRRERLGNVKLNVDSGERSGKLVAELRNVTKVFDGRAVVRDLDLRVMRGDRLGLIGPNGAGKSTLLKLILGTLEPDAGDIRFGSQVSVAYFDQLRAQLDLDATVAGTVSLAELEAIYAQTARDLEKLDFSVNTMLDVKQNRILIDVGDRAWFEGQLESVGVELDEAVDVIEVEGGATARDMNLLLTPPVPGIAFPRQKPVEGYRMCMTALMIGTLQQEGECLFIQSIWQGNKLLPIWPPEYSLRVEGDQVLVLDAKGEVAVRVGDEVYMGGGGGTPEAWTLQQIPPACRGEYFIVGCEVRLNLKQDAELFDLEMLSDGTHTALFLRYKPALSQQVTEPVSISGLLAYSANHRCPYLQSSSGGNPNLLWPPDWSARLDNGVMIVLDAAGQVVARSGEQVSLHGRAIPHSADFPAYGQLINELPGDCMGLTWLVDP